MAVAQGLMTSTDAFHITSDTLAQIAELGLRDTPFLSRCKLAAPVNRAHNIIDGHTWVWSELGEGELQNGYEEGSAPAPLEHWDLGSAKNHYQIFKNTYGVSGTQKEANEIDGGDTLLRQKTQAYLKHRKSIEQSLLSDQAPQARNGAAQNGLLGGVRSFLTVQNSVNAGGANVNLTLIDQLGEIFGMHGKSVTHAFINNAQRKKLNELISALPNSTFFRNESDNSSQKDLKLRQALKFYNLPYQEAPVEIVYCLDVPDDTILFANMSEVYVVEWRPTKDTEIPSGDDAISHQIITEITLRINTPFSIGAITGLGV